MGSLSSHVNNKQVLSNSFHNAHTIKCKNCESTNVIQQTYQICQSNDTYILTKCPVCNKNTEYLKLKTKIIYSKCFEYNKYQNEMFTDEIKKYLTKQFENTFNYCNKNDNKFLMSLQKGVYPYEYVNDWDKFDETTIPFKEFLLTQWSSVIYLIQILDTLKMYLNSLNTKTLVNIMIVIYNWTLFN